MDPIVLLENTPFVKFIPNYIRDLEIKRILVRTFPDNVISGILSIVFTSSKIELLSSSRRVQYSTSIAPDFSIITPSREYAGFRLVKHKVRIKETQIL